MQVVQRRVHSRLYKQLFPFKMVSGWWCPPGQVFCDIQNQPGATGIAILLQIQEVAKVPVGQVHPNGSRW